MEALEQLMLFTEASLNDPVKTSRSLASKRDCRGSDQASGLKCSESSQNLDPLSSLLKTCVEQSISPSIPCTPVWSEKVTKSTLTSFQHLRLVRPTKGKDCSSSESGKMWPTPSTRDYKGANGPEHFLSKERPHLSQLPNAVKAAETSGPRHSTETTEAETNPVPSEPPENVSLDGA